MKIIKTYRKDIFGRNLRAVTEKKLFSDGYAVDSEEEIKEWNKLGVEIAVESLDEIQDVELLGAD